MDEGPPSGKTLAQWHYHILHLILQVLQIKSYSNDSRQQSAAIQVYFDLTEVKQWHEVMVQSTQCSQVVSLRAQQSPNTPGHPLHIIPLPADTQTSMQMINDLFKSLQTPTQEQGSQEPGIELCDVEPGIERDETVVSREPGMEQCPTRLTLALVDSEGTITYHHVHSGLHVPSLK